MKQPERLQGARLCVAVRKHGVTLYGNPAALRSLADRLLWVASANPAEHYECHTRTDLQSDECRFEGKRPLDAWVLVESALAPVVSMPGSAVVEGEPAYEEGFDVTFMAVEENDLDELAKHQETALLPEEAV